MNSKLDAVDSKNRQDAEAERKRLAIIARLYAAGELKPWQIERESERARKSGRSWPPGPVQTTYAMVATGRTRQTGVSSPLVTSYTNNVLRPIMVKVASEVADSVSTMKQPHRGQASDALNQFGDAMDTMVSQLHQGQTDEAIAGGARAVNSMLAVTQELGISGASNALVSMKGLLRDQIKSGSSV